MDSDTVAHGIVYLVGAGPGDPGLITLRGAECLRLADVVVYDRLADARLLDHAPPTAERVFVGKASSDHTLPQEEINRLLVHLASQGKTVVRLKGGDPFVFGRGGEEALALQEAGIAFEVVPGVTSAVAAPAYAGIPVTHRGLATSFAVVTGHRAQDLDSAGETGGAQTLVYLMGVGNLANIVRDLLNRGCEPDTPAALIHWGTTPRQATVVARLRDIADQGQHIQPPAVLVVGDVVSLRDRLNWYERRPLFGKRILVTRSAEQAGDLTRLLLAAGAEPVELPLVQVLPVENPGDLDGALQRRYDWIVFTSVNGVRAVWERLQAMGADARALAGRRLCAIGPATAAELATHGLRADYVPEEYIAEAVVAGLGDVGRQRVLLPSSDIARDALAQGLRSRGAIVDKVAAYRTVAAPMGDPASQPAIQALEQGQIDALTFASSSAVRAFVQAGLWSRAGRKPLVACIGPVTANTARELGLPVDVVAAQYTIPGLVTALARYYQAGPQGSASVAAKEAEA